MPDDARLADIARLPGGELRLTLEGLGRMQLDSLVRRDPFWLGTGRVAEETGTDGDDAGLLAQWKSPERVYLIIEQERLPHWQQVLPPGARTVVAAGTRLVLCNQ